MSATATTAAKSRMRDENALPILAKLLANKGAATPQSLDSNSVYLNRLAEQGMVKQLKSTVKTGQRGRPAHLFNLTSTGRSRIQRAINAGKVTADGKIVG